MQETLKLVKKMEQELEGLSYTGSDRNNCVATLLTASIEHGASIAELVVMGRLTSAYALIRPMFESSVRGLWIASCATDEQIEKIVRTDNFPKKISFAGMIAGVESAQGWAGTLSEMWERGKNALHSFTHGGMHLVAKRLTDDEVYHKPGSAEIADLEIAIVIITSISFSGFVQLSGTREKDDFLEVLFKKICEEYCST